MGASCRTKCVAVSPGRHQSKRDAATSSFRELHEEIGLTANDVDIVACTRGWLRYRLPRRMIRTHSRPVCIGQKQKWFLLQIRCEDSRICMTATPKPEFDGWRWVSYWYPLGQVVPFKREVYRRALRELSPCSTIGANRRLSCRPAKEQQLIAKESLSEANNSEK